VPLPCTLGVPGRFEAPVVRSRLGALDLSAASSSLKTSHFSMVVVWLVSEARELLRDSLGVEKTSRCISPENGFGAVEWISGGGSSAGLLCSLSFVSLDTRATAIVRVPFLYGPSHLYLQRLRFARNQRNQKIGVACG
jgi:hypothetical protein